MYPIIRYLVLGNSNSSTLVLGNSSYGTWVWGIVIMVLWVLGHSNYSTDFWVSI